MGTKLRIAFFIDSLHFGGAEKSLVALLRNLDYSCLDVDLYAWSAVGEFAEFVPGQVRMHTLPSPPGLIGRLWRRASQSVYSLSLRAHRLLGIVRHPAELYWQAIYASVPALSQTYDVAVAYQQGFPTYYVASKVKAKKKIAWVNCQLNGHNYRESFNRRFYDRIDAVVTVSDLLHKILCKTGYFESARLATIYDIIDAPTIRQLAADDSMLLPYNLDDAIVLTTVARLSAPKNYPLAVNTARILKDRGVRFKWLFVGDGVERHNVCSLINTYGVDDCVIMTGFQINPYPFIKRADIYVQTSRNEGFGITLTEAKILGKPIVSTNFPVVFDQIADGFNGLIAEMTPESVADKIQALIADSALRLRLAGNAAAEAFRSPQAEMEKFYKLIYNVNESGHHHV